MDRFASTSSLRKSYSNEPTRTLSFVNVDNDEHSEVTTHLEKNKSKTEKSVHFADEESIAEDDSSLNEDSVQSQTSKDVITWLPSEHLYSDDTFIHETETETAKTVTSRQHSHEQATSIPTEPSYGSNTFVELESDEADTDTEQLYSYTDSFVSSEMFSSQSRTKTTYKEWKDVTEIVKDIEELEESEFVTRADSLELEQSEDTEASETFDDEIAEAAREEFVAKAIRQLRLKELQSPRTLAVNSVTSSAGPQRLAPRSKEEKTFCYKMIEKCRKLNSENEKIAKTQQKSPHPFYAHVNKHKNHLLEYYGLNPALIDRLKFANLQHAMEKKSCDLDKEIMRSQAFVENNQKNEAIAREKFISQMCAHVRRENMEDTIQAHLIKMHPVTQFAEFVRELPQADEDAREILYEYKRQLEHRMQSQNGVADIT